MSGVSEQTMFSERTEAGIGEDNVIVELKAQGLSHSKIAKRMGITTGTSERDFKVYKMEVKNGAATAIK